MVVRDPGDGAMLRLVVPLRLAVRGGRTRIEPAGGAPAVAPDPALIGALRRAWSMTRRDARGLPVLDAAPDGSYHRRLLRLAFLAPDLQRAILDGRQPPGLTLARLIDLDLPLDWTGQRRLFAAAAAI